MRIPARILAASVIVASALASSVSMAQTRAFIACTVDVLGVCVDVRLTATESAFEIALRTVGATGSPTTPLTVYNLIFATGAAAVANPVGYAVVPLAVGGATVNDASPWDLFDSGDALFLSATSNRGIGGCVAGADVGGFGQAITTCGAGQYATFSFAPTAAFNPALFTFFNLEAVALTQSLQGASCGGERACTVTEATPLPTTVPEPSTVVLLGVALGALGIALRRHAASRSLR